MNVLVGCEFSGIVRDAFAARGHYAVSCDLIESERPGHHYQGNVLDLLDCGVPWDLAIFHPPCTYTAVSGNRWLRVYPERRKKAEAAIRFFKRLHRCGIPKIALEQPISIISTAFRKPDQIIQPYQFGHPERKKTCLWLVNLPPLRATRTVQIHADIRRSDRVHHEAPHPDRWKNRSRTYTGIARAMALQWGS